MSGGFLDVQLQVKETSGEQHREYEDDNRLLSGLGEYLSYLGLLCIFLAGQLHEVLLLLDA